VRREGKEGEGRRRGIGKGGVAGGETSAMSQSQQVDWMKNMEPH